MNHGIMTKMLLRSLAVSAVVFGVLFLLVAAVMAAPAQYGNFTNAEYVHNYDGDTITFNLPDVHPLLGENISVRVNGVDTPEIRGKCAQEKQLARHAKHFVEDVIAQATNIQLFNVKRGKYFRIVADVMIDGANLNDMLLQNGLAVTYDGKRKSKDWCSP